MSHSKTTTSDQDTAATALFREIPGWSTHKWDQTYYAALTLSDTSTPGSCHSMASAATPFTFGCFCNAELAAANGQVRPSANARVSQLRACRAVAHARAVAQAHLMFALSGRRSLSLHVACPRRVRSRL